MEAAVAGETGYMVAFECSRENGYECRTKLIPLTSVANVESKVPLTWIGEDKSSLTQDFIDYLLPLVQGEPPRPLENSMPRFARLKKIKAE